MAGTHLLLHPGESIRTPRMLLVFYEQDRWRGQNLLRQVILSHYRPKRNGEPLVAPITWGTWGGTLCGVHLDYVQKILQHELPIDYYWIDAEWYGQGAGWHRNVGHWEIRRDLYPDGFKPLRDALRGSGRQGFALGRGIRCGHENPSSQGHVLAYLIGRMPPPR
jgi:alpha-galactosidase